MAKLKLIITADYEVWGEGSGHVQKCMIEPTFELMNLCEAFDTRLTIFAEICEYWAFEEIEQAGRFRNDYKPATWIKEQLQLAISRGHDVQLHTHPQWLNYQVLDENQFSTDISNWRTALLPRGSKTDPKTLDGLIYQGKQTLEIICQAVDAEYRCRAFRAGDWCIQPEADLLDVLKDTGFAFDTSVARGVFRSNQLSYYDFRNMPEEPFWRVSNDLKVTNASGKLTEVPIHTTWFNMSEQLFYLMRLASSKQPARCPGTPAIKKLESTGGKFERVVRKLKGQFRMLDFSDGSSLREMKEHVRKARRQYGHLSDELTVPLVMIGHPKNFTDPQTLQSFMEWVVNEPGISLESNAEKSFWQLHEIKS